MDDLNLLKLMESALRDEWEKYDELFSLSRKQLILLREDEPDVSLIAQLMNQKIEVVHEIQSLEAVHLEVKQRWEKVYLEFSEEDRQPVRELRDRTITLIEHLNGMEYEVGQRLRIQEEDIQEQLRGIQQEKKAAHAYLNVQTGPPRFIDKKK